MALRLAHSGRRFPACPVQVRSRTPSQTSHHPRSFTSVPFRVPVPWRRKPDRNMRTQVAILSTPTADTNGSAVFLFNEETCYMVGRFPGGFQRTVRYAGVPWTRLRQTYFLSGNAEWEAMSGLPGMLFNLAASSASAMQQIMETNEQKVKRGQKPITPTQPVLPIHGPDNMSHILAALRPMVMRQPLKAKLHEHREDSTKPAIRGRENDWEDRHMRVWKVPVQKPHSGSPWKRRHVTPTFDEDGCYDTVQMNKMDRSDSPTLKPRPGPSDPYTAQWVVENGMLDGSMTSLLYLAPKQARDLDASTKAWKLSTGALSPYKHVSEGGKAPQADEVVFVKSDSLVPGGIDFQARNLPTTTYGEQCMSYIFRTRDHRGKFDLVAAKAKGVKPKYFKLLCDGQNVVTESGETVTPDMVLGKSIPGTGFVVADIPDANMVEPFFERPEWTDSVLMDNVVVMYWILGPGLYDNARIVDYMRSEPGIRHIISAPETSPNVLTNPKCSELTTQFHRIDPERYPLLQFNNTAEVQLPEDHPGEPAQLDDCFAIMPEFKSMESQNKRKTNLVDAVDRVSPDVIALAEKARQEIEDPAFLAKIDEEDKDIPNRDAEITCLGTSSSNPTDLRGLCGTLVRVPGIGNYLLDCGEGTFGQLLRAYGKDETDKIIAALNCIVISHFHGDHVLGLVSIIKAWYSRMLKDGNSRNKLAIACSARVRMVIEELSQAEDVGFHRLHFTNCSAPGEPMRNFSHWGASEPNHGAFGLKSIDRVAVTHCPSAYGTQLELTSGLRIAWSGDCRPSTNFADAFQGAHLLVHEATFDADEQKMAEVKKHSTLPEALGIASRMKARRTLLTHFSARYRAREGLLEDTDGTVLLGWDFMRVKLGDFKKASRFLPALEKLAMSEWGKAEETAAER